MRCFPMSTYLFTTQREPRLTWLFVIEAGLACCHWRLVESRSCEHNSCQKSGVLPIRAHAVRRRLHIRHGPCPGPQRMAFRQHARHIKPGAVAQIACGSSRSQSTCSMPETAGLHRTSQQIEDCCSERIEALCAAQARLLSDTGD